MVDHFEMRQAMLRAIDVDKTNFTDVCNICKAPNSYRDTNIVELSSHGKTYQIWHCENCYEEEKEKVLV